MSINQNSFEKLLNNIELCNTDHRWYLSDPHGDLKIKGLHKETKASDKAIVGLFHNFLANKYELQKSNETLQKMSTFIEKSSEIDIQEKQPLIEKVKEELTFHTENKNCYLNKTIEHLDMQKTNKGLQYAGVKYLELRLSLFGGERLFIISTLLQVFSQFFQRSIIKKLAELGVKIEEKKDNEKTLLTFDYNDILDTSPAEEVAINMTLERQQHLYSDKKFKSSFHQILQKNPSCNEFLLIKIRQLFLLHDALDDVETFFEYLKDNTPPVRIEENQSSDDDSDEEHLFSKETYAILGEFQNTRPASQLDLSKTVVTVQKLINSTNTYRQGISFLNDLYRKGYQILQSEIKKQNNYRPIETNKVFNYTMMTPDELEAMMLPACSFDELQTKLSSDVENFSAQLLEQDESFCLKHFVAYFLPEDQCLYFEKMFCKLHNIDKSFPKKPKPVKEQDALVDQVAALSLQTEKTEPNSTTLSKKTAVKKAKKKPKKRQQVQKTTQHKHHSANKNLQSHSSNSSNSSNQSSDSLAEVEEKVRRVKKPTYQITPIPVSPRVKDWLKNNPTALQKETYAQLSEADKEKAKILHSYPITITHFLRQYGMPEKWNSKTAQKTSTLYSQPGTIEWNGKRIIGYFADCFDSSTLYHHYFHERPLHVLRDRYKTSSSFLDQKEQSAMAGEMSATNDAEEVQTQSHFQIRKRNFSIEVKDTANNIVYTVCFPEGIDSE